MFGSSRELAERAPCLFPVAGAVVVADVAVAAAAVATATAPAAWHICWKPHGDKPAVAAGGVGVVVGFSA